GGEELGNQVAMSSMDFDAVKAGLFAPFGAGRKVCHNAMDFLHGHFPRHFLKERIHSSGRCNGLNAAIDKMGGLTARVINLAENLGIVPVNGLGQFPVALQLGVVVQTRDKAVPLCIGIDGVVLSDDEPPAAFGFFFKRENEAVSDHSVFGAKVGHHGWDHKTIGNCTVANFHGGKQLGEHKYSTSSK